MSDVANATTLTSPTFPARGVNLALWLLLTVASLLVACAPPLEFGLLYFALHEAPLFLILFFMGVRAALLASGVVSVAALLTWGLGSHIDWLVTVAITLPILVGMHQIGRQFGTAGIAWRAISAWLFVGAPIGLAVLYFSTSGNWQASQISVAYLLISGATSGVLASAIILLINFGTAVFPVTFGRFISIPKPGLPQILEAGLVVIAFLPLLLLVSYSAQSYLQQTYEQIGTDAKTRFELAARGVALEKLGVQMSVDDETNSFAGLIPTNSRIIQQAPNFVHWIPENDDVFRNRRYKKLSEYRAGRVTALFTEFDASMMAQGAVQPTAIYGYTTMFWDYFELRFYALGVWYIGVVLILWVSALLIRSLLTYYLLPLQSLSHQMRYFRPDQLGEPVQLQTERIHSSSLEIEAVTAGFERLRDRVERDIFQIETISKRMTALVDYAPIGILAVDKEGNCTYRNPSIQSFFKQHEPTETALIEQARAVWSSSGAEHQLRQDFAGQDGSRFLISAIERIDYANASDGAWILVTDVSELVASQNRIEHLVQGYDALMRSLPLGVLAVDAGSQIVFTNNALLNLAEEVQPVLQRLAEQGSTMISTGRPVQEWVLSLDGKSPLTLLLVVNSRLDDTGEESGFWLIVMDLSEQRRAQSQLVQASKLATLGEMSTGLAHEINQPLNAIALTVRNLRHALTKLGEPDDAILAKLERIDGAVNRAAAIIDRMRAHGRIASEDWADLEVGDVIMSVLDMLGEQLRLKNINLKVDVCDVAALIRGNAIQLEQVLMNLVSNAKDAILARDTNGGDITITLRAVEKRVLLSVSDTGGGIPENVLPHIFDPFFTTKPVGKGTGLGGSISYGIIHDMQGTIWAENIEGGARIQIELPAVDTSAMTPEETSQTLR